jgi:Ca2+/Na+ antiporter
MKLNWMININAVLFLILGIAFGLYSPLMLNFFGVPDIPSEDLLLYWTTVSFARLYGAALFGFGLVLWALRGYAASTPPDSRRGLIFSLLLANIFGALIAATQSVSIWQSWAGWLLLILYLLLILGYGLSFKERPAPV